MGFLGLQKQKKILTHFTEKTIVTFQRSQNWVKEQSEKN